MNPGTHGGVPTTAAVLLNSGFPLAYVTGVRRFVTIPIMPLVSNARKYISLHEDGN